MLILDTLDQEIESPLTGKSFQSKVRKVLLFVFFGWKQKSVQTMFLVNYFQFSSWLGSW